MSLTLGFICYEFFNTKLRNKKLKRLTLLALSSSMSIILLMSCTGGSGNGAQEESTNGQQETSTNGQQEASPEQQTPSPELAQKMETGKTVYNQYCVACHQADGNGVTGAFPTLQQTEHVLGDKNRFISIVIDGLQGPIEVKGEQFNSVMPPHGFLTDEQIAGVITYVRKSFGNDADEVTAEEVKQVRDQGASNSTEN